MSRKASLAMVLDSLLFSSAAPAGEVDQARRDWIQILLYAPDSDAAASARINLKHMDVKVR